MNELLLADGHDAANEPRVAEDSDSHNTAALMSMYQSVAVPT